MGCASRQEGERVQHNLKHDVVTIMWDKWDAPDRSRFEDRSAYGEYIEQTFPHLSVHQQRNSCDQIWRFYHDIRIGDLVILPLKRYGTADDWIAVGRVTSEATRGASHQGGALHRRSVRWLASKVPKSAAADPHRDSINSPYIAVFEPRTDQAPQYILGLANEFYDAQPPNAQIKEQGPSGTVYLALSGDEAGVAGEDGNYVEGVEEMVAVLAYERNAQARQKCIDFHGTRCKVCGIDFGEEYGGFADGYIHVHHVIPLAQAAKDGQYELDPIDDLVPVCPNCHAMLHRHDDKPCTVETLKETREARMQSEYT